MRSVYANEQSESLHKDALISSFKKDLHDLRDKEHQYTAMTDDVHNCEARIAMLQEEKARK